MLFCVVMVLYGRMTLFRIYRNNIMNRGKKKQGDGGAASHTENVYTKVLFISSHKRERESGKMHQSRSGLVDAFIFGVL